MRFIKIDENAWEQLKTKASEIADSVQEITGDNSQNISLDNARWLIEHDIPLTAENLIYKNELDGLAEALNDNDRENLFQIAVGAMQEGRSASSGVLISKNNPDDLKADEQIALALQEMTHISDAAIKYTANINPETDEISLGELINAENALEAEKGSGALSAGLSEQLTIKEVKIKIRLEEVRYGMNLEAGRRLMSKGINIISDSLLRVTEGIRELEKEYLRDLYKEIAADDKGMGALKEASATELELALKTEESLRTVSDYSLEL